MLSAVGLNWETLLRKHCVFCQCFSMFPRVGKLGDIVSITKMFLNLFGHIFVFRVAKFYFARKFPDVDKLGNAYKHNVAETIFPSLPRT